VTNYKINQREASSLRIVEGSNRVDHRVESFNEAADDFEKPSEDPEDAIPIVPLTES
jgi:hypothetical protein